MADQTPPIGRQISTEPVHKFVENGGLLAVAVNDCFTFPALLKKSAAKPQHIDNVDVFADRNSRLGNQTVTSSLH